MREAGDCCMGAAWTWGCGASRGHALPGAPPRHSLVEHRSPAKPWRVPLRTVQGVGGCCPGSASRG